MERNGLAACGAMAVVAWGLARGRMAAPLGVVAGGALVAVSYLGLKGGIDGLVRARPAAGGRIGAAIRLVKFFKDTHTRRRA